MAKGIPVNRWITLSILGFSGGLTYELPYLRFTYHDAMLASFHLDNTQLGVLMSLFGFVSMLLYAPSGLLADRFSHRKLIATSTVLSGLAGFVFATYPPFEILLVIQMVWAFTSTLLLWSPMIKAASMLGAGDEQGKLMGWLEGLRGAGSMIVTFLTMWIFSKLGARVQDLAVVIDIDSTLCVLLGVACWFVIPDSRGKQDEKETIFRNIKKVLALPTTWYIAIVIFSVYTVIAVLSYTQPYLSSIFGMTTVTAGFIAIVRNQVFRAFCCPLGGVIIAKTTLKSPTKIIIITSGLTTIALAALIVLPPSSSTLSLMVGVLLFTSIMAYVNRGLYFATVGEVHTPVQISGSVIGIASVIGFLPDTFVYILIGHWQDTYPGLLGYQYTFGYGLAIQLIGILAGFKLYTHIKRQI